MVVCGTDLQKRFEGTFANDRWEGLEWYAEYLVFVVMQLQFATFLKQLNYSSRSFAVESRHNLLLLDLNITQLNFCSWVKTQPPRNRVACSKIKVFTSSSPQTCSLFGWQIFFDSKVKPSKEGDPSKTLHQIVFGILFSLAYLCWKNPRGVQHWILRLQGAKSVVLFGILILIVVNLGGWGLDNCT